MQAVHGATNRVTNRIVGTQGVAELHPRYSVLKSHDGSTLYEMPEPGGNGYVQSMRISLHQSVKVSRSMRQLR